MAESIKSKYKPSYPRKYKVILIILYVEVVVNASFKWCDLNESILQWGSEEFHIPYISPLDKRVHKYYPDFIIKVKESNGEIKTYVIEVKPKKQTKPPTRRQRVTKSYIYECKTWEVNQAKWKAAVEFCEDRKIEFKIITEVELGIR